MLLYEVRRKAREDAGGREWLVGRFPSRDDALAHFNGHDAASEGIGAFTFDDSTGLLNISDYQLIEREASGPEVMIPLYMHHNLPSP
jgi:hypothetical protein